MTIYCAFEHALCKSYSLGRRTYSGLYQWSLLWSKNNNLKTFKLRRRKFYYIQRSLILTRSSLRLVGLYFKPMPWVNGDAISTAVTCWKEQTQQPLIRFRRNPYRLSSRSLSLFSCIRTMGTQCHARQPNLRQKTIKECMLERNVPDFILEIHDVFVKVFVIHQILYSDLCKQQLLIVETSE